MTGIDLALCVLILLGVYGGYKEGFLMALFSLLAILLGVLGAFKLLGWAMVWLAGEFNIDKKMLPYIAFAIVFVVIVIVVRLLGNLIKLSLNKSVLGSVDSVAGAVLGLFKTVFLLSVCIWIIESLNFGLPEKWTNNAWIFPKVAAFAPMVTSWISEVFPVFKDVF